MKKSLILATLVAVVSFTFCLSALAEDEGSAAKKNSSEVKMAPDNDAKSVEKKVEVKAEEKTVVKDSPTTRTTSSGWGRGQVSPEEMKERREKMYKSLGLTDEQIKHMDELNKKYEGQRGRETWRQRREEMNKILTPEQQQKMMEQFQQRRRSRNQ